MYWMAAGSFGNDYVPTLYPLNAGQRSIAKTALKDVAHDLGEEPAVQIGANPPFPAEPEHQDFYKGRALRLTWYGVERQSTAYKDYREGCTGRDAQVEGLGQDGVQAPALGSLAHAG